MTDDHTTMKDRIARIDERVGHLEDAREKHNELLYRIDERVGSLLVSFTEHAKGTISPDTFYEVKEAVKSKASKSQVQRLENSLDQKATKEDIAMLKKVVYGAVGLILTAVGIAVLNNVI